MELTLRLVRPSRLLIVPASNTSLASTSMNRPYTVARTWLNLEMNACLSQSTTTSDASTKSTGWAGQILGDSDYNTYPENALDEALSSGEAPGEEGEI